MFSKNKSTESWEMMKKWRNEATQLRRRAIKGYWKEISQELDKNPRKCFKTFSPFLSSKIKDNSDISLETEGGLMQDQQAVVKKFTSYFSTVANEIGGSKAKNLKEKDYRQNMSVDMIAAKNFTGPFKFSAVTNGEVLKALKYINSNKATGHDNLPPKVLKLVVSPSLTHMFNRVISEGAWPREWKKGDWVPVYKKENPQNKGNYRPVTTLTVVDKIFEQFIGRQLGGKFEQIFDTFMSAYRKLYSCETTLIRLVEDWRRVMDEGHTTAILSTDMSKAFDSLHPTLLLAKLEAYGVSDDALRLMKSYFEDRQNRTKLGNVTSRWDTVTRGCPQGSCLGPLLWNIYQNDLFYMKRRSQLSAYADDHQLYASHSDPEQAIRMLTIDGENTSEWYKEHFLEGHLSKYQTMIISRKNRAVGEEIVKIDGVEVKTTQEMKLMGVNIDHNLTFSKHISGACKLTCRGANATPQTFTS